MGETLTSSSNHRINAKRPAARGARAMPPPNRGRRITPRIRTCRRRIAASRSTRRFLMNVKPERFRIRIAVTHPRSCSADPWMHRLNCWVLACLEGHPREAALCFIWLLVNIAASFLSRPSRAARSPGPARSIPKTSKGPLRSIISMPTHRGHSRRSSSISPHLLLSAKTCLRPRI